MHGLRKYRPVNAQTYDPLCVTTTALEGVKSALDSCQGVKPRFDPITDMSFSGQHAPQPLFRL
jgi:hypothetical protein